MSLEAVFNQEVRHHNWWTPDTQVLVAVSGGVDSMVLLSLIESLPDEIRPLIGVAHVNHQLREASDEEQSFLETYCQEKGYPFYTKNWAEGKTLTSGIEACAREVRYTFFSDIMLKESYSVLVTAHHEGDQAETMMMRLTTGQSLFNLSGIKQYRPFATGALVRPLLSIKKSVLYEYAKEQGIPYFEDSTNQEMDYLRNRLRLSIIPLLEKENPQFSTSLSELSQEIQYSETLLQQLIAPAYDACIHYSEHQWHIKRDVFLNQSKELQFFVLQQFMTRFNQQEAVVIGQGQLREIEKRVLSNEPSHESVLKTPWVVIREYDVVRIEKKDVLEKVSPLYQIAFNQGLFLSEHEWLGYGSPSELLIPTIVDSWERKEMSLRCDTVTPIIVRKRRNGDRFIFNEQGQKKKVSRYFIDEKIAQTNRDKSWVVTDGDDNVIWLLPFRESYLSIPNETDKIQYKLVYYAKNDR